MKTLLTLFTAMLICTNLFSQDMKPVPMFKHEIGTDVYPILQNIFKSPGFGVPGSVGSYSLMYRLHVKNLGAFRARVMMNSSQNSGFSYILSNGKTSTEYTSDPNKSNSWSARIGWQFNKTISSRWNIYGGLDLVLSNTRNTYGYKSTFRDSSSSSYTDVNSSSSSNKSSELGVGGSVFGGVSFKLGPHFNISYELCFDVVRNRTKQSFEQLTVYHRYDNQGTVIFESTNNNNKYNYTMKQTTEQLIPLSILMLSYIF